MHDGHVARGEIRGDVHDHVCILAHVHDAHVQSRLTLQLIFHFFSLVIFLFPDAYVCFLLPIFFMCVCHVCKMHRIVAE